ncbi:MAG TPA: adenylate/guanylate cyclase domain-containing protein, partial [Myxococcales bacterium]|nr:adenylate/guanylate cyclase domain-containing protein [Myxococcales bacterium]
MGAIAFLLALLLALFLSASRASILQSAEALRDAAARRIEAHVATELSGASQAVSDVEAAVRLGVVAPDDPRAVEATLFEELLRNEHLSEVTFTRANRSAFDADGSPILDEMPRWQLCVFRTDRGALSTRVTRRERDAYRLEIRDRRAGGALESATLTARGAGVDPTVHLTFQTPASRGQDGRPVWTDLSWAEADAVLPAAQRRVVVSVQQSIADARGRFAGVVRAGLVTASIDAVTRLRVDDRLATDPHQVFLTDPQGRLVTRTAPGDELKVIDDSLRFEAKALPPAIAAALHSPALAASGEAGSEQSADLSVAGERWLATFRPLAGTQDWIVGIVVPESAYTATLRAQRVRFLIASLLMAGLILLGGGLTVVALRRGLDDVLASTRQMSRLDFKAAPAQAPFRDVQSVIDGLERAKTALRALGKYVPVDLVRTLYRENREPTLGGEMRELTILFTDLEGFTGLAERLSPDGLAKVLGLYLETMTGAIRETGGTIDKFIGDAVMVFWNAPEPQPDHATRACAAVLACRAAAQRLYSSPSWTVPPLHTRFGLHCGDAMVGHFGSPERLSYTALGDSVNLASRLEGLCKQYGVDVLVSEAVRERAANEFAFRVVDRVAVKGRAGGVLVYELLGRRDEAAASVEQARQYEMAFAAYARR